MPSKKMSRNPRRASQAASTGRSGGRGEYHKPSKLRRLLDAGVIPSHTIDEYTPDDERRIEKLLSEEDLESLIRIKLNLGSEFFKRNDDELKHFIFF